MISFLVVREKVWTEERDSRGDGKGEAVKSGQSVDYLLQQTWIPKTVMPCYRSHTSCGSSRRLLPFGSLNASPFSCLCRYRGRIELTKRSNSAPTETGMSRLSLSDTDKQARDWFAETTKALGCTVTTDAMGNQFAIRPGLKDGPPTVAGSHLDTQPTVSSFLSHTDTR